MAKYKYVNTQTGATFESDVVCGGGPWKQIDNAAPEKEPEKEPEQEPEKEPEQEPEKEPEETPKKGKKESK